MDSEKILNIILSDVYNAPTQDSILFYDEKNGRFIVGGVPLAPNRSQEIIEAAQQLDANVLFQYLINELEYDGSKRTAVQAADWERVRFGKAQIYAASLLRDKVKKLKDLTIKKPKEPKVDEKTKKENE